MLKMDCEPFNYVKPLELNETAALIFEKKEKGISNDDIASFLSDEFGVSKDDVIGDIINLEKELSEFGVIFDSEDKNQ